MSDGRALVEQFAATAPRFEARDGRLKRRLLHRLTTCPIRQHRPLLRLHESLCFLQAYPDDARVLKAVNRALEGFPARVRSLGRAARERLRDSGVAGTTLNYAFSFPMARWLARRFPAHTAIVWRGFKKVDNLRDVLSLLVNPVEEEAFSEFGLEWQEWLRLAKGGRRLTDLQLLVELFEAAPMPADVRDSLFEGLALPITWTLHGAGASRTLARLLGSRPCFRGGRPFVSRAELSRTDVRREIERPLPALRRAPERSRNSPSTPHAQRSPSDSESSTASPMRIPTTSWSRIWDAGSGSR